MFKIKKTYGNGVVEETIYSVKNQKTRKKTLSKEESKRKNSKNTLNQKKKRAKVLANSSPDAFNYCFTFTSGNISERNDYKILLKAVKDYLNKQGITYFISLDISHPHTDEPHEVLACSNPGYHVHGICNKPFDFKEWKTLHKCTNKALYLGKIKNVDKFITYMLKNYSQMPSGIHLYHANYKKINAVTEIYDQNNNLIKTSQNKLDKNTRHVKNTRYVYNTNHNTAPCPNGHFVSQKNDRYDLQGIINRYNRDFDLSDKEIDIVMKTIDRICYLLLNGAA